MVVLVVLVVAWLAGRGLGVLGVEALNSWVAAARFGLAMMLLFTASAHLTIMKQDLVHMVPTWVPRPQLAVYLTGVCEVLGAVGLLVPGLRRLTGIALILFFIAVFPANVHAARTGVRLGGRPVTPLWLRAPMQLLFIGLTWWCTQ